MARPKAVAQDMESQVEALAAINCSWQEIADVLGVNEATARRRFARAYKTGMSRGKMSLKRKMFDTAMKGNVALMIFLSKQMLGYSDKVEQKSDGPSTTAHVVVYETSLGSSSAREETDAQAVLPS